MKRILIADDDFDMREMLGLALAEDFDVTLASNGFEAIRRLERETFDALLLDLSMPVLDGRGVVREMRRRRIAVPVVILSAEMEVAEIARQLDVAAYLVKPVRLDELRGTLMRTTSVRRMKRAHSGIIDVEI